ncbi:MAG: hypothetical protein ACKOCX_08360 [Planctomycetota bacterium]
MHLPAPRSLRFSGLRAWLPVLAAIASPVLVVAPFTAEVEARPPRAERVANRIAERRYARLSIAEARTVRAEARVAEIAPAVPVPPPPRPATVRRLARAGVPLGGPMPPAVVAPQPPASPPRSLAQGAVTPQPPVPQPRASAAAQASQAPAGATPAETAAAEPGAWTLAPEDDAVSPAAAEVAPDGTRSVLSAGGASPGKPTAPSEPADRPGPAVTQPPVELLPTPAAK